MRRLSAKTKHILGNDPRMKKCALRGIIEHYCSRKIDWHHNLIYGGRQSDIPNTILGICSEVHQVADRSDVKQALNKIMYEQMTEEDFKQLPKLCKRLY
jgi:hypothetical protein